MQGKHPARRELLRRIDELQSRLSEAEDTLHAIRSGEVDAIVVSGADDEQVFTLKGADQPYRILIETMNEGTVTVLTDGTVVYSNSRFADMLRTPLEQVIGAPFTRFLPPGQQASFRSLLDRSGKQGSKAEFVLRASVTHAGAGLKPGPAFSTAAEVPVQISARALGDPQGDGFCLVITDLTERKRAEMEIKALNAGLERRAAELTTANKELEAFTYSVAHDLRTPLRGLNGFGAALLEDYAPALDEQAQSYIRRIREASVRMAQLIDDLLNLSRISRAGLRRESVSLSHLADTVVLGLQKASPERRAEFVITPLLDVEGDPHLLRIVFDNLLGNAWKFTARRDHARIELGTGEQDCRQVYFIRDNGVGFDMRYVDKLFAPFQRLHSHSEFPGTGIGLATTARIVHKHGGEIWAEGAVDQGATFYFTLGGEATGEKSRVES